MPSRLEQLRTKLDELKLDAIIVSHNADQRHLAGFSGHADYDSILLISKNDARIVTDFRYWEAAEKEAHGFTLVKRIRGEYDIADALRDFAKANNVQVIGFEAQHVNVAQFQAWKKGLAKDGVKLKPTEDVIKSLRAAERHRRNRKGPCGGATHRRRLFQFAKAHPRRHDRKTSGVDD